MSRVQLNKTVKGSFLNDDVDDESFFNDTDSKIASALLDLETLIRGMDNAVALLLASVSLYMLKQAKLWNLLNYNIFFLFYNWKNISRFTDDFIFQNGVFDNQTYNNFSTQDKINLQICEFFFKSELSTFIEVYLQNIMKCYVNPTLAVLGLAQNILCISILKADGFRKTRNLLLLSVVVAGSLQHFLSLNIAEIIEYNLGLHMYKHSGKFGCIKANKILLRVVKHIFICIGLWGQYWFSSTFMLITIERLVVVFLPLKLKSLVTIRSVSCCILFTLILWLPLAVYKTYIFYLVDTYFSNFESGANLDFYDDFIMERELAAFVLNKFIPLPFVLIGSTAIAVKIKMALVKRRKMTTVDANVTWSNRTTKTLLLTCSVYTVSEVCNFALTYIAAGWLDLTDTGCVIQSEFINFSNSIATCSTFLIFIATNRKLCNRFILTIKTFRRRPFKN